MKDEWELEQERQRAIEILRRRLVQSKEETKHLFKLILVLQRQDDSPGIRVLVDEILRHRRAA